MKKVDELTSIENKTNNEDEQIPIDNNDMIKGFYFFGVLMSFLLIFRVSVMIVLLLFLFLNIAWYLLHRIINKMGDWPNVIGTSYRFPLGDVLGMQTSRNGHYLLNLCKQLHLPQVYRIWVGPRPVLMLAHPEAVRQFWQQHDEVSINRVVKLGWSLLLIMGEGIGFKTYHNRNRINRFFHECFGAKPVTRYEKSFEREVDLIMKRLETLVIEAGQAPLDIAYELKYLAHDAGMDMFLGPESNKYLPQLHELVDELVVVMTATFDARYINLPILQWLLPKAYRLRFDILAIRRKWDKLLKTIMNDCIQNGCLERESDDDSIIVRYMRQQATEGKTDVTYEELSDTIIEGLLAPSDGFAATFANTLVLLALNPQVQEEARERIIHQMTPNSQQTITAADLAELDYLDYILSECQRILPIFMFNVPELTSCEMTLGGVTVPKETMVMYDVQTLNRSEDIWPNPLAFQPERFAKINEKQRKALHGFGNGRSRRCLGEYLVRNLHKLFIARILLAYRLAPGDNERNIDELPRARRPFIYVPHVFLKFTPINN